MQSSNLIIPFVLYGRAGRVEVTYGSNEDPERAGFDILNLPFDVEMSRGYPFMHTEVVEYDGYGYRLAASWIQVITGKRDAHGEVSCKAGVDVDPVMRELGIPFFSYGYMPRIFDAPCNNIGSSTKLEWVADTFFTTMPGRSNGHTISPLFGFRWGYVEYEPAQERPVELMPLTVIDHGVWNAHLPLLRETFPKWQYADAR